MTEKQILLVSRNMGINTTIPIIWLKSIVVTIKPRRSRRGRGAAAMIKNTKAINAVVTPRWPRIRNQKQ